MGKNTNENDVSRLLRELAAQVCTLSCRVEALEKENELLKQNNQQGNMTLFSISTLSLIISLVGIEHETLREYLGNEETQKIQYFAKVALARASKNGDAENHAFSEANAWAKYHDYYNGGYEWASKWNNELENKTVFEIVKMIEQMMNGATLQNENRGTQR